MGNGNVADLDELKKLRKAAEEFKLNLEERQKTLKRAASVFKGREGKLTKRTLTWITATSASIKKAIAAAEEMIKLIDADIKHLSGI